MGLVTKFTGLFSNCSTNLYCLIPNFFSLVWPECRLELNER